MVPDLARHERPSHRDQCTLHASRAYKVCPRLGLWPAKEVSGDPRCPADSLDDLCEVVRESTAVSHVNIPQLVGREDGSTLVNTYDWQTFLKPAFKRLPGMLKFAHFRMSHQHPDCVFVKMSLAEVEEQRNLLVSREAF